MGYSSGSLPQEKVVPKSRTFVLDPDRVLSFFRVMVIMWAAYLSLMYVDDIPGGSGLVAMAGSLGMAVASMPQLPVAALMTPAALSISLAGTLYIFIVPHLTTFIGLKEIGGEFETRIQETLNLTSDTHFTNEEGMQFYSLLGANRGLCEALLNHARRAGAIDWQEWRKPRF